MNLEFSATEKTFRDEVQTFLTEKLTQDFRTYTSLMTSVYSDRETALAWQAILAAQGWAAPSWPVEHGGCDWTVSQHYIFQSEMSKAGAPPLSPMGIGMCGPALLGHGSAAQKAHYLPRILSGEDYWSQGYSEPHAGSDLAQLTMSATEDGNDYICNGSKIWTTHAHESNMMFCLVRTDATGRPQQGITFILIDMNAPGVTVDPIGMLTGEHIQNAVFFDDVRVPKANVIGEVDKGWTVAKYLLEFERGGTAYGPQLQQRLNKIRANALELGALDSSFAQKISQATVDVTALEYAELRLMADLSEGGTPGLRASMMKINGTELSQHLTELAIEVAGAYGAPFQPQHLKAGGVNLDPRKTNQGPIGPDCVRPDMSKYFNDRAGSIYAGSNEIQRNILSKGQLGL